MSGQLLERVSFRKLAERGARIRGEVSVAECRRLAEGPGAHTGEFVLELTVRGHDCGLPVVEGEVRGELSLVCQRCLEPMPVSVHKTLKVAVIENAAQLDQLPAGFEPFHAAGGIARLLDIGEEELLLALPDYPVHPDIDQCGALVQRLREYAEEDTSSESPFDVLRGLKTD